MDSTPVVTALRAARDCAVVMRDNAMFILDELEDVGMDEGLRVRTEAVSRALLGSSHDVTSELFEMEDLLTAESSADEIEARIDRLVRWLKEDMEQLHLLVTTLDAASHENPANQLGFVLVVESAANVLQAFVTFRSAAEARSPD